MITHQNTYIAWVKREVILELFEKFEQACYIYNNVECWSARELQSILGYSRWENFFNAINKAKKSCENSGANANDHFRDITKMIDLAKGAQREVDDIALTRYACYLIAQNGDPAKPPVAFAQKSEKKLSGILYERDIDNSGFALIRSKGDQALFGGFSTNDMKKKLGVPAAKPLADFLPTLTIKAKDFANELTSHNVIEKDLIGQQSISKEHVDNNKAVRDILLQRGVKPEALPAAEDIKKLERRLDNEGKSITKSNKKGSK